MKKMYWTAHDMHPYLMILLCVVALSCTVFVEKNKYMKPQQHYKLMLEAAKLSSTAMQVIKHEKERLGIRINPKFDPSMSGMIGVRDSIVTSDHGVLRSKQISINPNIAGLIVLWLKQLNLKEGDTVAIGMTGSFPGLNTSTLAAIETLKLKPIVILSATGSMWGANNPRFIWLDMMEHLYKKKVFPYEPIAASIGASRDVGKNLKPEALSLIKNKIKRVGIPLIEKKSVAGSIKQRMQFYSEQAGDSKIKLYINIGGGIASIGRDYAKKDLSKEEKRIISKAHLKSGINTAMPISLANTESVAVDYLKQGVPVINIRDIQGIATTYNLKVWKRYTPIGWGPLFMQERYNLFYAIISLIIIFASLIFISKIIRSKIIEENKLTTESP